MGSHLEKVFGAMPPTETKTSPYNIAKMLRAMNQHADLFRNLPLHSDRIKPQQHKFSAYKSCRNHLLERHNFHISSFKRVWSKGAKASHFKAARILFEEISNTTEPSWGGCDMLDSFNNSVIY
jgi:hypothetical protein